MPSMNLRTHIAFVSLIIMVIFLIWKMTRIEAQEKPAVVISGYAIEVVRASYGLECGQSDNRKSSNSGPYANSGDGKNQSNLPKENNILSLVSNRCNSRVQCEVMANPKDFPNAPVCSASTLTIEYRCFMLDKLRRVTARDMDKVLIDCSNPQ
jgi:hypothetical protein